MNPSRQKVAQPPAERPLMLYDGECTFCCRWIKRWEIMTGDKVNYATSQSEGSRFPEIPQSRFQESVCLVEPDGTVCTGADAVYRCLKDVRGKKFLHRLYEKFGAFARFSESAYRVVAKNRYLFSFFTRLLWGNNVEPPTYIFSSYLFVRLFGLLALIALISYRAQVDGLISSEGILPLSDYMERVGANIEQNRPEASRFSLLPTVFWWSHSDAAIHWVFIGAMVAAVALILGFCPPVAALALYILYMSLMIAGQAFLSFQWDILLVEVSFLVIFFSSWKFWDRLSKHPEPPPLARWLIAFLLFRLMFESGMVKLQSYDVGDLNTWRDNTALNFHYWTQPIPSWTSWYAHHMPSWFHWASLKIMFIVELVLPFFLLAPRRLRNIAIVGQILLQVSIMMTGNYGFFNLLTILLCIPLIDDQSWPLWLRNRLGDLRKNRKPHLAVRIVRGTLIAPAAFLIFAIGLFQIYQSCDDNRKFTRESAQWLEKHESFREITNFVWPFRIVNGYGLFRVMTTTRPEIIISGSMDRKEWKEYTFHYKPGDPKRAPEYMIPHMPRLDWRMWFEGLSFESSHRFTPWFRRFLQEILEGNPTVLSLLEENPFPDKPPAYFRVQLYHYTFTDSETRRETGAWWNRELLESYTVTGSLKRQ